MSAADSIDPLGIEAVRTGPEWIRQPRGTVGLVLGFAAQGANTTASGGAPTLARMNACTACGAENPEGARFCASCGTPLASICGTCGAPLPENARFCAACGTSHTPEPTTRANERKLVTVLFADVTGSTALGEQLDPERMREVLDRFFAAMREEIEAEGGTVEKFIGDAVMAAFGVPAAHEDDPARAVRAATRMLRRLNDVNDALAQSHDVALQIRIGVNTGEVLATTEPRPGEAMVTGDTVNAAARLQAAAEPGSIVIGERTARGVRGFRLEDLGPLELKGKAQPVRAFLVADELSLAPERGVPGLRAPMVGRGTELELLRGIYARVAAEGRPSLVTIYGDAGVGKSRLMQEFLAWAGRTDPAPQTLRGRCLPYGEGITYSPLAEILKGQAGVLDSDGPELVLEKIRKAGRDLLTTDVASDPVRATAALAYTVGIEDPEIPFADLDPRHVRTEVHAAWRSYFSALATMGPVVAAIEDIHWADAALLDLLDDLGERARGPILVMCPSRPDLIAVRPDWGGGRRNFSSISLDPLTPEDADVLIHALLAIDDLPASVHARILERAEGNPFFLEEIVRHLIDEGRIVREGERWRAMAGIEEIQIPDTVQGVLAARIDLLEPEHKRALQGAAVVGRVFWPGPVGLLLGDSAPIDDALRTFEDRELVLSRLGSAIAGEPEYIFKHILTREVAYESLPRRERGAMHALVARWLEETVGDRSREFVELLAHHYATAVRESAGEPPADLRSKAFDFLLRASADARSKMVLRKAEQTAEAALSLAASELERSLALEALAETFLTDYRGDLAWRCFRESADARLAATPEDGKAIAYLCARAVDVPTRWPGSMRNVPAESVVRAYLERGVAHLPDGDSEERVRLRTAQALWPFGFATQEIGDEYEEFERIGLEAAEEAMRLGRPTLASGALDAAAGVAVSRGLYGRGLEITLRRFPLIPHISDLLEVGDAYAAAAWGSCEIGRYDQAVRYASEGIEIVHARGGTLFAGGILHMLAWRCVARYRLGAWDEAVGDFDEIRGLLDERREDPPYFCSNAFCAAGMVFESRGEGLPVDEMLGYLVPLAGRESARLVPWLGRLLVERGELTEARRILDPPPYQWRVHAGSLLETLAELLAAEGRWDEVPGLLERMRAQAVGGQLLALPAFADRLEGRAALAAGDAPRAADLLRNASATFAEIGAVWERARTDLFVADASLALGDPHAARARVEAAIEAFERLRAVKDLLAARERSSKN